MRVSKTHHWKSHNNDTIIHGRTVLNQFSLNTRKMLRVVQMFFFNLFDHPREISQFGHRATRQKSSQRSQTQAERTIV